MAPAPATPTWVFLLFGLVLLSHYGHGESARELGFRGANFRACLRLFSPALLFAAMLLLAAGILFQTLRDLDLERAILGFLSYCTWGLFQQYVLNAYFVNRLLAVSSSSNPGGHARSRLFRLRAHA